MKTIISIIIIIIVLMTGCYDPSNDKTSIQSFEWDLLEKDEIVADSFSVYHFIVKLPGLKYGKSKELTIRSSWGTWPNDSAKGTFLIPYNEVLNMYIDTVRLKSGRNPGLFSLEFYESSNHLTTIDLVAIPLFPSKIQIVADSLELQLSPGNSTGIRAYFYSEVGFPTYQTKFRFTVSDTTLKIYPLDLFIGPKTVNATLQISTDTEVGEIEIGGEIVSEHIFGQPIVETTKIKMNK